MLAADASCSLFKEAAASLRDLLSHLRVSSLSIAKSFQVSPAARSSRSGRESRRLAFVHTALAHFQQKRSLMDLHNRNGRDTDSDSTSEQVCVNGNVESTTTGPEATTTCNSISSSKADIEEADDIHKTRQVFYSVSEKDVEEESESTRQLDLRVPPEGKLGLGASEFREAMRRVTDEYLQYAERVARGQEEVRARVQPGYLRPLLPTQPPEEPASLDALMADFKSTSCPERGFH